MEHLENVLTSAQLLQQTPAGRAALDAWENLGPEECAALARIADAGEYEANSLRQLRGLQRPQPRTPNRP